MRTTLYGYIEEMDFWKDPIKTEVQNHNARVIESLNVDDEWPPLSREMFSITRNSKDEVYRPNLEYSGRIIHFGANLKSVEHELDEWVEKFEVLLSRLLWIESKVHFQTEYCELQTLQWNVGLNAYNVRNDGKFPDAVQKSLWEFKSTWENT
ncbi:hypothetical protein POV27_07620 [Aureisphaera galaxeae]|uniref:hypothetical protein n=1 Tax=Aureisphaera galaxeae TaxID=1538023 RepID=UPI002350C96C|nr:hypothetical protein [Aureisphaera galaxeae]MDC8003916.1 hypothetical protein [Aureisphaera galaxeae]